jgi:hypothetical protein
MAVEEKEKREKEADPPEPSEKIAAAIVLNNTLRPMPSLVEDPEDPESLASPPEEGHREEEEEVEEEEGQEGIVQANVTVAIRISGNGKHTSRTTCACH